MSKVVIVPDLLDILPFHQSFNWERFQILCADLLFKRLDIVDSREYLKKGSPQKGIDVYSTKKGENKLTVAQCKLVEYLGPQKVLDIIDEFLRHDLANDTDEFILCTSANLKKQRDEEKTITKVREKLLKFGIDFIVWDADGLSMELRTNPSPEIVYHYFGEEIAHAFYGNIWYDYISQLRKVKKRQYEIPIDYIERKIISYSDNLTNRIKNTWNFWEINQDEPLIKLLESREIHKAKRIVLLSTAGYGKTQEINFAAGYFSSEEKLTYPIKFSLRDYEGQSIETILSNYSSDWKNIREDDVLLLFDGLDEISEKHFQTFINHLNSYAELNTKSKIVVSSRYNFYDVSHTPQLRGFEIFLLNPLTPLDINNYLNKKLDNHRGEFEKIIRELNFNEYIQNPYYLTRLVRFYIGDTLEFPKNTTDLFERILFEQLEKDAGTYNIPDLKEKLFPLAREIAFCMTIAGKSTLTDEEMKDIVSDSETKKLLNHFSIINRNASVLGAWSFEHKNLQEYLCASVLLHCSFANVHKHISFEYDRKKLLPRFINTIAFLFEILNNKTSLFKELFNWLNQNECEILIRFEKEQLSKKTRDDIFYRIFEYYKKKQITLRISANFSYEELAGFVGIDETIIDYFQNQFSHSLTPILAYDTLSILGNCIKPFLYKEKIKRLLFTILRDTTQVDYIFSKAITTFVTLGITEKDIFEEIIVTGIDLNNREIREACVYFLNNTEYYEEFSRFLLDTIHIVQKTRTKENIAGPFISLKQVLLKFHSADVVKELLRYCLANKNLLHRYAHYKEFHFDLSEVKNLMDTATEAFKIDKSILPIVYRLFCRLGYISHHEDWFKPFYLFFKNTCGTEVIFQKFYKYDRRHRDLMAFADINCCDFLIQQYKEKKIDENELRGYRNILSHINYELFLIFYEKLKLLDEKKFIIEDINVDYNKIRIEQKKYNQVMLLDRKLFFEEAKKIFKIIGKKNINASDLWASENVKLRVFQDSLVYTTIRNTCIHNEAKLISKNDFLGKYENDKAWSGFVIDSIVTILKEKDSEVNPALMVKINEWCINKIESLKFEKSIEDQGNSFTYIPMIEFVKEVFLLLDLDLEDSLYLKMLPSDYETFYSWDQGEAKTIASVVISKVKDKVLLKETVLGNIKNKDLAILVLCSHFSICKKMRYKECLPYLFNTITSNPLLQDLNKVKLTEYYMDLGGEISDFNAFLKIPMVTKEEEMYSSWCWFLIEKMLFVESGKIIDILLEVLNKSNQDFTKLKASELLIQLGRIEGLKYWEKYIKETKKIPFENKWATLQKSILTLPTLAAIEIFFSVLEFYYVNSLQNLFRGYSLIDESVFSSLIDIANTNYKYYLTIKQDLEKMINRISKSSDIDSLRFFSERLTQRYFESHKPEIEINAARKVFREMTQNLI